MKRALGALLLVATGVACGGVPAHDVPFIGNERGTHRTDVPAPRADATQPVRACARPTLIGEIKTAHVTARRAPGADAPAVATFRRINAQGSPQVFDLASGPVRSEGRLWYRALLPVRPNGTTGYVPSSSLHLVFTSYRLALDGSAFRLTLFEGCRKLKTFTVGVGTGDTPTPTGRFYLASLMRPPDPNTIYGVYAYGLSAYSNVLVHWTAGGIIGLHGTNDPSSIGRRSSHGCIRMRNEDISRLAKILPLGTPISIS